MYPVSEAESSIEPLHPLSWPRVSLVTWPNCAPSHCTANCKWRLVQIRRALPGTFHLEQAGVAEVEIGAHRLRLQAHAPGILRVLPQSEIGFGEAIGLLFRSKLEIDPAVVRLDVGKAGAHFASCFGGRRNRRPGGALEQILEIPASLGIAHQVEAGFGQAEAGDFQPPAQQANSPAPGRPHRTIATQARRRTPGHRELQNFPARSPAEAATAA